MNYNQERVTEILNNLTLSDNLDKVQQSLRLMLDAYFLYHEVLDKNEKERVYSHFKALNRLLDDVNQIS